MCHVSFGQPNPSLNGYYMDLYTEVFCDRSTVAASPALLLIRILVTFSVFK